MASICRKFERLSRTNTSLSRSPKGASHTDMELVYLPRPTLEYESNLKLWQWKVKLILEHMSLWHFVPVVSAPRLPYRDVEVKAAATHCTAILASCISETILSDLLTILLTLLPRKETILSRERELPEEPHILFEQAGRMVKAAQMIRKEGSIKLQSFLFASERPASLKTLFDELDALPRKGYSTDRWLNVTLIAILLIKRYGLASLTPPDAQKIIERAHDVGDHLVESDFNLFKAEVVKHDTFLKVRG